MIPQAYITEWSNKVPWQTNEQVEQDLVICRALVEIFSDEFNREHICKKCGKQIDFTSCTVDAGASDQTPR